MATIITTQTCAKCKHDLPLTKFKVLASGKGFFKTCINCHDNNVKVTAAVAAALGGASTTVSAPKAAPKAKKTKIDFINEMDIHYAAIKKALLEDNNKQASVEFAKFTLIYGKAGNF